MKCDGQRTTPFHEGGITQKKGGTIVEHKIRLLFSPHSAPFTLQHTLHLMNAADLIVDGDHISGGPIHNSVWAVEEGVGAAIDKRRRGGNGRAHQLLAARVGVNVHHLAEVHLKRPLIERVALRGACISGDEELVAAVSSRGGHGLHDIVGLVGESDADLVVSKHTARHGEGNVWVGEGRALRAAAPTADGLHRGPHSSAAEAPIRLVGLDTLHNLRVAGRTINASSAAVIVGTAAPINNLPRCSGHPPHPLSNAISLGDYLIGAPVGPAIVPTDLEGKLLRDVNRWALISTQGNGQGRELDLARGGRGGGLSHHRHEGSHNTVKGSNNNELGHINMRMLLGACVCKMIFTGEKRRKKLKQFGRELLKWFWIFKRRVRSGVFENFRLFSQRTV